MGRIPEDVVDEVLARASIVDVIGDYVKLQKRGTRFLGLCPFHNEKSPSFSVNAERNLYYCFGCQASGNTVGFLMKHDGLAFPEAIRRLAERVGVTIPESSDEDPARARQRREQRQSYQETMAMAARWFLGELWSGRHKAPLAYLQERGIDEATAKRFGLGFAPAGWSGLVDEAGRRSLAMADFVDAGLVVQRDGGGGYYDRFRNRVMFPVIDLSKKVLAFSGRTLDDEERAKYVNSPETAYYTKGDHLFGLHAAQKSIREHGHAVLVEGNFDVVSLHAQGITTACAALGTALTERQARLLRRFTERVVLLFDGDRAGRAAARKALDVLMAVDMPEVVYAALPDGTDPDDFVRSQGPDALRDIIDRARPMLDVCVDEALAGAVGHADAATKRAAADAVAELLAPVRNRIVWRDVLADASRRLEIEERELARYVREATSRRRSPRDNEMPPPPSFDEPEVDEVDPLDVDEALLLELLAARPSFLQTIHVQHVHHILRHGEFARLVERVAEGWARGSTATVVDAVAALGDDPLARVLRPVLAREATVPEQRLDEAFDDTLAKLKLRWIDAETRVVEEEIRRLESASRFDDAIALYERQQELLRWRHALRGGTGDGGADA